MGTLYWAFNRQTKRAMELGKWHDAADQKKLPIATTRELIRAAMPQADDPELLRESPIVRDRYLKFYDDVATKLEHVGLPVEIKSEHFEGFIEEDIVVTESVYTQGRNDIGTKLIEHIGDNWDYFRRMEAQDGG